MGTLWLGGAEGLICPKFYTDNHKHPPLDIARVTSSTLPKFETPPLGHCLCDVIINIPKGLICSFLWPIFSSCFARISPTVCPNFTRCLPEFGGAAAPPCPPPHTPMLSVVCHNKSVAFQLIAGFRRQPQLSQIITLYKYQWLNCRS